MFCVVRHAEAGLSVVPAAAVEYLGNNGWTRVSEDRPEASDFHLPEFADAPELDAAPESDSPAEPDKEEE
jgi:hypothetical protein